MAISGALASGTGGGEGGVRSISRTFTQVAHGLSVGNMVYFDGIWRKAKADAATTLAEGLVSEVSGDNIIVVLINGIFVSVTAHGLGAAGTTLWVSDSTAGALTSTEPSAGGSYSQVVGQTIDANTIALQTLDAEGPL